MKKNIPLDSEDMDSVPEGARLPFLNRMLKRARLVEKKCHPPKKSIPKPTPFYPQHARD